MPAIDATERENMALFRHNTNDSQSPFDVDDAPAYVAPNADIVPDEEEPTPPASRRRSGRNTTRPQSRGHLQGKPAARFIKILFRFPAKPLQ